MGLFTRPLFLSHYFIDFFFKNLNERKIVCIFSSHLPPECVAFYILTVRTICLFIHFYERHVHRKYATIVRMFDYNRIFHIYLTWTSLTTNRQCCKKSFFLLKKKYIIRSVLRV